MFRKFPSYFKNKMKHCTAAYSTPLLMLFLTPHSNLCRSFR